MKPLTTKGHVLTIVHLTSLTLIILTISIYYAPAQDFEDKILSSELKHLLKAEPERERILIICIEPDQFILNLQLKTESANSYSTLSYKERASKALNSNYLINVYSELLKYGKPFYAPYRYKEKIDTQIDSVNYLLFLNAFLMNIKIKDIEHLQNIKNVKSIMDGEEMIGFDDNNDSIEKTKNVNTRNDWSWNNLTTNNWGYEDVGIGQLHSLGFKGQNIKIGIIDSGIEYDHPAVNMVVDGLSWSNSLLNVVGVGSSINYNNSNDVDGHGTMVAGVTWQMAPLAEYYIYKYNKIAGLWQFTLAINYMQNNNVDVINLSIGWDLDDCPTSLPSIANTYNNAFSEFTIPVTAAGNFPDPVPTEATYGSNVICVFSHKSNNNMEPFGSPINACPSWQKPNLSAPGSSIVTLDLTQNGLTTEETGSSFASPHVAGIAGILKQIASSQLNLSANSTIVKNSILLTLNDINNSFWDGYNPGKINSIWAYDKMLTINPIVQISSPSNGANVTGTVNISVNATDSHSGINNVEIWIGGIKKATITQPPYNYTWNTSGYNPGNIQIMAKAFDNVGNTTSQTINVNVQAMVVELYNGYVTPSSGFTGETYSFKVSYKNTNGVPPNANSINIHIAGESFIMNAGGSNWTSGVEFSKNLIINGAGNHQYYFTGNVGGVNLRFPSSGFLNLSVTQNAIGWDARVTEVTASTYNFTGTTNITFTGKVHNNSNSPDKVYYNLQYDFKVFNPTGDLINSTSGTISQINQTQTVNATATFSFSASLPNGIYQTVFSIYPLLDNNPQNNVGSVNLIKGSTGSIEQYSISNSNAYVFMDQTNLTHNFPNSNTVWQIVSAQTSPPRARLSRNGVVQDWIYANDFRTFDGGTIMISCAGTYNIPYPGAIMNFGSPNSSIISYTNTIVSGFPGQQITFTAHTTSQTFSSSPEFYRDNGNIENWYSHYNRYNNNQSVNFYFNIPSSANPGNYDAYLAARINPGDAHVLTKIRITVLQPAPVINSLSSYNFSADDVITISGTKFGTTTGQVKFNTINGSVTSWTNTSITCIVPVGVTNGLLTVINTGGTSNPMSYQVISSTGIPIIVNAIPDQTILSGVSTFIANLNNVFSDPNNHPLTFSVSTSDPTISYDLSQLNIGHLYLTASIQSLYTSSVSISAYDITNKSVTDEFELTVLKPPPSPVLLHPLNNSDNLPVTVLFQWSSVPDADFYSLEVATNIEFINSEFYIYNILNNQYDISALSYCSNYYWRVFAYNEYGSSEPSSVWTFQTVQNILCTAPNNLAAQNISHFDALFTWNSGSTENSWEINYGTSNFNPESSGYLITGVENNYYNIIGLEPNTVYDAYVRAVCDIEVSSDWAGPVSFTTLATDLSVIPESLNFGEIPINNCLTLSYILTGTGLTNNVIIYAPVGFQISSNETMGYMDIITVPHTNGSVDQRIYVRFCPTFRNAYIGNIINFSTEIITSIVSVSGYGIWFGVPPSITLDNIVVPAGQIDCFDATETIIVAGNGSSFDVQSNAEATFIAGNNIIFYPGFHAHTGSFVNAHITTTDNYCDNEGMSTILCPETTIVHSGHIECFEASQIIMLGGFNGSFDVENGGYTRIIAGNKIQLLPGVHFQHGSEAHCYISTNGYYCNDPTLTLENITIIANQSDCFEAIESITVAGNGSSFIVQQGGEALIVAGQNIIIKEGTHVEAGGYFHAWISTNGILCSQPNTMLVVEDESVVFEDDVNSIAEKSRMFKVYPNPTTGKFMLEMLEFDSSKPIQVIIYSMLGNRIFQTELFGHPLYEFDLSSQSKGFYIVRVISGEEMDVEKVIVN